jgi:hypothetical protein
VPQAFDPRDGQPAFGFDRTATPRRLVQLRPPAWNRSRGPIQDTLHADQPFAQGYSDIFGPPKPPLFTGRAALTRALRGRCLQCVWTMLLLSYNFGAVSSVSF